MQRLKRLLQAGLVALCVNNVMCLETEQDKEMDILLKTNEILWGRFVKLRDRHNKLNERAAKIINNIANDKIDIFNKNKNAIVDKYVLLSDIFDLSRAEQYQMKLIDNEMINLIKEQNELMEKWNSLGEKVSSYLHRNKTDLEYVDYLYSYP